MAAKHNVVAAVVVLLSAFGVSGCALTGGDANEQVLTAWNRSAEPDGNPTAEAADCEESDLDFEGATLYDCRITYTSGRSEMWCAARHDASDLYGMGGRGTCAEYYERSKPPS
jgi:hypothetical protein